MVIEGMIAEEANALQSTSDAFNKADCLRWNGVAIQFTTDAKGELWAFKLDAYEIIDMLNNSVECPKYRKFKREEKEICSHKNGRIFRIILFKDYCRDVGENCWCVKHVKPT